MKFYERLIGDDRFSVEHKVFNVLILLGAALTLFGTISNYFSSLPIHVSIFSAISFLVFVSIYFYSILSRKYKTTYLLGIGYLIGVYYPGVWILETGSFGGFQYYLFFFLVVFIVTSPRKEKLFFFYLQWVLIIALLLLEYHRADLVNEYDSAKERLIDIIISISFTMIAIYISLNVFVRMYKNSLLTIQTKNDLLLEQNELIMQQQAELKMVNDEKDKLFRIIGHDLRSPFNSILGFCNELTENVNKEGNENLKQMVSYINTSSEQSFKLVEDLLHWASSQQGQIEFTPQIYTLPNDIENTLTVLQQQADTKKITLSIHAEPHKVKADLSMLKTIVRNLVSNAIKYTHEKGTVTVSIQKEDDNVQIIVQDTGIGMTADKINKLFLPGQLDSKQGTNGEKGTGFGLLICKDFIDKHKGSINITSEPGAGSTFCVSLPVN